jgi:hypothetical protein
MPSNLQGCWIPIANLTYGVLSEHDIEQVSFDDGEALAAWRLFLFNWRLLASLTGVLVAGLIATESSRPAIS